MKLWEACQTKMFCIEKCGKLHLHNIAKYWNSDWIKILVVIYNYYYWNLDNKIWKDKKNVSILRGLGVGVASFGVFCVAVRGAFTTKWTVKPSLTLCVPSVSWSFIIFPANIRHSCSDWALNFSATAFLNCVWYGKKVNANPTRMSRASDDVGISIDRHKTRRSLQLRLTYVFYSRIFVNLDALFFLGCFNEYRNFLWTLLSFCHLGVGWWLVTFDKSQNFSLVATGVTQPTETSKRSIIRSLVTPLRPPLTKWFLLAFFRLIYVLVFIPCIVYNYWRELYKVG